MKKPSSDSIKITAFFKPVSNTTNTATTETTAEKKRKRLGSDTQSKVKILKSITNLPQCSNSPDVICVTPEPPQIILRENTPSPDIIPCTLNVNVKTYRNRTTRIQCNSDEPVLDDVIVIDKTPEKKPIVKRKLKSSEKKLYDKPLKSINEYNVEIIENFVNVSPSKQSSPVLSQIQHCNEETPTKNCSYASVNSPMKAKMKLEFNENGANDFVNIKLDDSWDGNLIDVGVQDHTLDLTTSQHCKVQSVCRETFCHTLVLSSSKEDKTAICDVEGFWLVLNLQLNDTIYISALYEENRSRWLVNNAQGLIVFEPDLLISATSIVGSRFCMRRSILQQKYSGFEPSNQVMVVGILVHKLLQEVLRNGVHKGSEIEVMAKKLLFEKDTVWMCYESDLSVDSILKELMHFTPRIESFIGNYVKNRKANVLKGNWTGSIEHVEDIEENIWCHHLGVKGKVDITVRNDEIIIPLEVKTGRATVSLEHRGQVIFYIMMMQKMGYQASSGLLLYLQEGVLREIAVNNQEKRDLMILRNKLAYYLSRKPKFGEQKLEWELPEPINYHSACSKCPYNTICCTMLKYDDVQLTNNPLQNLQNDLLAHLQPTHIEYFMKWSALLTLENSCSDKSKQIHEIYTIVPQIREKNGQCIINVTVKDVVENGCLFEHSFVKEDCSDTFTMHSSGICVGNYVIVSTNSRPAVAAGFVTDMDTNLIVMSLDRNLNNKYAKQTFHLDTYSSSTSQGFNMTNLSLLLEATEQADRLRTLIIDKQLPTFEKKLPKSVATEGTAILQKINKMQQKAVLKSISTNDYLLIKGMPGTGKTDTIVSLIELLVRLNKTILITSHTHSAIDNVCLRLVAREIEVLRLGSSTKIHPKLHPYCESTLTKHCETPEQLNQVYSQAKVLAVTCLGSGHVALNKRQFDVCVVDESTQVLQCSLFRALYRANKFVLVGDPDQLPPIVRNQEALTRGMSESLFERLDNPVGTVMLRLNYRMNKPITDMANALTYQGQLLTANEIVANATLELPNADVLIIPRSYRKWIIRALDVSLLASVRILDTGSVSSNQEREERYVNHFEAAVLKELINALLVGGVCSEAIGVIAPYRSQVSHLLQALKDTNVEVNTVDQFQGRDKEVIFYSCTRSDQKATNTKPHSNEILEDKRRLTVAITRAKYKFILIGDLETIRQYSPFEMLLNLLDEDCFIYLKDGCLGFQRKNFTNIR
ncbi:hypothetical protein FQA39_LY07810 [Lamprigera yunnana]|nr:hypothetical protein FQA39_LY07810 [Lamprigera yunnana]